MVFRVKIFIFESSGSMIEMKYFFLIFTIIVILSACKQQESDTTKPPEAVRLVYRAAGADTLQDEPGIDAVYDVESGKNGIQLMWYTHPQEKDLASYRIYRSEDPQGLVNYNLIGSVQPGQAGQVDTVYIDTQDLVQKVRYYYYITAYSKKDKESENSDTLSYELLEYPVNLSLNGNSKVVTEPSMRFEWHMASGVTPDYYILRVEYVVSEDFHPVHYVNYIYSEYETPRIITLLGNELFTLFPKGKYRWRVDCVGLEDIPAQKFSGSESEWSDFTINWGG